jgi:hypothetical protein
MKYWILHHQHKGKPIEEALRSQKWVYSQTPDIALFDTARNSRIADMFRKKKSTLVLYPHTAIAAWWYDGLMELSDNYAAMLVIGEGQKQVQQIITPNKQVEVIGWSYCQILPFKKPKAVKRILFAPIHPSGGGALRPEARDVNARVYKRLLSLPNVQIVLRVIGKLEDNGLWYSPKTIVKAGKPDGSYAEIDIADLVIAEGMYLSLAVARGKPAIGMNQRIAIKVNRSGLVPERWDEYNYLQAYPIDFDDGDIMELIDRASQESSVKEWKDRFIGEQLQPKKLSDLLIDIRGQNAR